MIFEAYVKELSKDETQPIKVKIPLYNNETYTVSLSSVVPGITYNSLKVGMKVLINFLNNDLSRPVIIGVVNSESSLDAANTIAKFNELEVYTKVTLPEESTIDDSKIVNKKTLEDEIRKALMEVLEYLDKNLTN